MLNRQLALMSLSSHLTNPITAPFPPPPPLSLSLFISLCLFLYQSIILSILFVLSISLLCQCRSFPSFSQILIIFYESLSTYANLFSLYLHGKSVLTCFIIHAYLGCLSKRPPRLITMPSQDSKNSMEPCMLTEKK